MKVAGEVASSYSALERDTVPVSRPCPGPPCQVSPSWLCPWPSVSHICPPACFRLSLAPTPALREGYLGNHSTQTDLRPWKSSLPLPSKAGLSLSAPAPHRLCSHPPHARDLLLRRSENLESNKEARGSEITGGHFLLDVRYRLLSYACSSVCST